MSFFFFILTKVYNSWVGFIKNKTQHPQDLLKRLSRFYLINVKISCHKLNIFIPLKQQSNSMVQWPHLGSGDDILTYISK